MKHETEVCVIGAGPAGATFATRMVQFGYKVILIERSPFPRRHVGEAMTPIVWELLAISGARPAVEALEVVQSTPARIRWVDDEEKLIDPPGGRPGFTVDRADFDQVLLDAARLAGAIVMQPARVSSVERTDSGWRIELVGIDGPSTISARFLADASGRSSRLPSRRITTSPRTIALDALWTFQGVESRESRIETRPEGWYWGAHLPRRTYRAMAFVDPDLLRVNRVDKRGLEAYYRQLLAGTRILNALKDPRLEGVVTAHDATCYFDPMPIDRTYIKLGEAAFAIDPLSSSGVQKALQTALAGSISVNTILRAGSAEAAVAFYTDNQQSSVVQHAEWAASRYREHRRYRAKAFWLRRARSPIKSAPRQNYLKQKADRRRRVQLVPGACFVRVPCAVGDHVEIRDAIWHPALARPVAFVNGVDIVALIANLGSATSVESQKLGRWNSTKQNSSTISWLVRQGPLETDSSDVQSSMTSP